MRRVTRIGIGCAAVLLGGCAANDERVAANSDDALARAESSITAAENAGAYEEGGAALNRARQKLDAAEEAAQDGEPARAARLAKEAELDATLASAIAENQDMQAAATELERSIETLQEEIGRNARNAAPPGAQPPGAQPPAGVSPLGALP